jgi:hypothetical protein
VDDGSLRGDHGGALRKCARARKRRARWFPERL